MLALLLLASIASPEEIREECDSVELNHLYDDCGRRVLSQFIFWEWKNGCRVVRDWRLARAWDQRRTSRGWVLRFCDGECVRCVETPFLSETWSQEDRERANNDVLPPELRSLLLKPRPGKRLK